MNKNDELEVVIEDFSAEGDGIAHAGETGYTLFIKDAVIGDRVLVRVTKTKKNYGYARLMKIMEPSKDRVEPKCEHAKRCGGCQLQQASYECQIRFKTEKIRSCLKRIGGFDDEVLSRMDPFLSMKEPFYYRNKAQFPVGVDKNGEVQIGFYAGHSHQIINSEHCYLQGPKPENDDCSKSDQIVKIIRSYVQINRIPIYDETTHRGILRHILIRTGFFTGEVMVCLIINGRKLPKAEKLIEKLTEIEGMKSISINVNKEKTNVILGKETITLWGQEYITDTIGGVQFQISPQSFYQVNPQQTEKLYRAAFEYAQLSGKETVWDLYCGIGTISLFLARMARKVYGVEIVPQAIEDAKRNAELNHIKNVEFLCGAAEEVVPQKIGEWEAESRKVHRYEDGRSSGERNGIVDVIVVDPPRKGCDPVLLETIWKASPERIVYVSCDPATLARDLKVLCEKGYEVERWRGCDMFPCTGHVETVCLLSKLHEAKHHVSVKLDMDELDITSAESKATYEEIKKYVLEETGLKVSNLYIAQVKDKHGLEKRENYNLSKSEDARQPKCPKEKEKAIEDALRHFQMILLH